MPLLSHTRDPRLSRTILEPVSYLVLLSPALLCSEVGNGRLAPSSLEQQRRNPHTKQSSFPFCSSVFSSASFGSSNDLTRWRSLEIQALPEVCVDCELCEEQNPPSWASLRRRLSLGRGSLLEGVSPVRLSFLGRLPPSLPNPAPMPGLSSTELRGLPGASSML